MATNLAPNPSFEIDLADWESASGTPSGLTRVNTGSPFHGAWSMEVLSNATANVTVRTPESGTIDPVAADAEVWSIGVHGLWVSGTPKNIRADLRWMSSATVEHGTQPSIGSSVAMNTSTWVQSKTENITAPTGTVGIRIRIVVVSTTSGDIFRLDGIQMEKAAALPAYNDPSMDVVNWGTKGYEIRVGM